MFAGFYIKGPNNLKCPNHINKELEIVYVKEGEVVVGYGKESVVVKKGQAAIVFPFWMHMFTPSSDSDAYVLMFPSAVYEGFYLQYKDKLPARYKFNLSAEMMVYVDSLIRRRQELTEYEVKSLYYAYIAAFFKGNSFKKESNSGLLQKMMRVIHDDILENITIKNVAEQCGVSETFLISYLKNHARIKFRDCVNGILISRAVELLNTTDLSITQVAIQSGFGSLRSFNRVFYEVMGCTPSQYRKK